MGKVDYKELERSKAEKEELLKSGNIIHKDAKNNTPKVRK